MSWTYTFWLRRTVHTYFFSLLYYINIKSLCVYYCLRFSFFLFLLHLGRIRSINYPCLFRVRIPRSCCNNAGCTVWHYRIEIYLYRYGVVLPPDKRVTPPPFYPLRLNPLSLSFSFSIYIYIILFLSLFLSLYFSLFLASQIQNLIGNRSIRDSNVLISRFENIFGIYILTNVHWDI